MGFFKRISRSRRVVSFVGKLFAAYLDVIKRTNRFIQVPNPLYRDLEGHHPVIAAMWHGQHFMIPLARRPQDKVCALVSRSQDGELNATVLKALGIRPIRGSGARGRNQRGGMIAMRDMLRALEQGEMVVMTADIPKTARICGEGIVLLAKLSGRPIVPVAVVTGRRIDFKSWDRASIGLPFGRGAMVVGAPIFVSADASEDELEAARLFVETGLDAVHALAYGHVGSHDPGAHLNSDRKNRDHKSKSGEQ